jgi:membrane-bound inhibitor of C-type lysozyme
MRRIQFSVAGLIALGLATAGCERATEPTAAPPEPTAPIAEPAPVAATWVCDSGLSVAVAYPGPQSAQITYRDRTWVMRAAPAASGARFVNAEVEWRSATEDGVERATLSRLVAEDAPVVLERCSRPAPTAQPVLAPAPGAADAAGELIQVPGPPGLISDPPCKGPQLRLSDEGGDAGAGSRVTIIGVQNIGSQRCTIHGYPTVSLQDGQGRALAAIRTEQRPGGYSREGQARMLVTLKPQDKAFFDIAWSAIPNEGQGEQACPSAARIRFVAPGDTSPVSLDRAFKPCGGRISVSPIRSEAEPAPVPAA